VLADQVKLHGVVIVVAILRVLEVEFAQAVFGVGLDYVRDVVQIGNCDVAAVCASGGVAGVVLRPNAKGDD